jgi:hypothetical protein
MSTWAAFLWACGPIFFSSAIVTKLVGDILLSIVGGSGKDEASLLLSSAEEKHSRYSMANIMAELIIV